MSSRLRALLRVQKVALVPCAISYDTVLEEGSMAAELTRMPKRGETLFGLLSTAARLVVRAVAGWGSHSTARGSCGKAIVSFGDPIRIDSFLKAVPLPCCVPAESPRPPCEAQAHALRARWKVAPASA